MTKGHVSCYPTSVTVAKPKGSTFTHLKPCSASAPWVVQGRNWSVGSTCFNWTLYSKTVFCSTSAIRNPPGNAVCLALTPHKGLYLPSWHNAPRGFRIVTVHGRPVRCPWGYLLQESPQCPVSWVPFRVGEPIPASAVQVSTWTNETPLYIIAGTRGSYIGYYLAQTNKSYIMLTTAKNPTDLSILVHNWQWERNSTGLNLSLCLDSGYPTEKNVCNVSFMPYSLVNHLRKRGSSCS